MKYAGMRAARSPRALGAMCVLAVAFVAAGATASDRRSAPGAGDPHYGHDHGSYVSHDRDSHGSGYDGAALPLAGDDLAVGAALPLAGDDLAVGAALAPAGDELTADSLTGISGQLRMRTLLPASSNLAAVSGLLGDSAVEVPGVYTVPFGAGEKFAFVTLRPFQEKVGGRIGTYRIGNFPGERGAGRNPAYANPLGFIEVTRENQDTHVSRHFRLRDFLTKDQHDIWPKYLVLDERLIDKLELVIADLREQGYDVGRMAVMSGFRTPQYNARGVGAGGRGSNSRHQFGDAADIFVDNNGNGRMDDLNGDGRVDERDARIILQSVERVEQRHPGLVGGAGVYRATAAHGPFVHVDARGTRARWGI